MRFLSLAALSCGLLAFAPAQASAQYDNDERSMLGLTTDSNYTGYVGAAILYSSPVGRFAHRLGSASGLGVTGYVAPGAHGWVGLRLDLHDLSYGGDSRGDTTLNNAMRTFSVGPQLMVPYGALRPYVAATVGLAYVSTERSYFCRTCFRRFGGGFGSGFGYGNVGFNSNRVTDLTHSRYTYAVSPTAGLTLRVWRRKRDGTALFVDGSVSGQRNGSTSYIPGADAAPITGRADYAVYRLGIAFGPGR